ncbi:MAG: substrate-binding domain-containing protein [Acidobacteria bacterium]|nr:substrate-binding domain-containing protein [Acidobacteriota bacterium]
MHRIFLPVLILILAGCSGSSKPEGAKTFTIGMSQCNLGEPWRVQMNADIDAAAKKHSNLKMVFKDAQNDTLKQRAHIEELVSASVDAIIVSPKESQPLTEPIAKAYQAKIPVIVLDRAVQGDQFTCFIGADNKKIGKAAGEWLRKKLGPKATVVELKGLMTSIPGQDRNQGFRSGIEGSGLNVAFEADMKWLEPDARKEMESALARLSKIDAVYAHNDPGAHGAWLAAKAANREREMLFIGIDALPHEGIAYVKQGILNATFQYPTGGAEAIDTVLKVLSGQQVPKTIVLGSRVYTADNVEQGGEALP